MDRRDFIKKATMAAAGAAVVSPVSAMINTVTGKGEVKLDTEGMQTMRTLANNMAFLLEKIHADGEASPKRDERPQFMNFIR